MLKCKKCKLNKPIVAFKVVKNVKSGRDGTCRDCRRQLNSEWRQANKERLAEYHKNWESKNKETRRIKKSKWESLNKHVDRNRNPEAEKRKQVKYRMLNRAKRVVSSMQWAASNRHLTRHYANMRRCKKIQATPLWANILAIKSIYELAQLNTIVTGILHHVDHIVPLNSRLVCGLHWEYNLQILSNTENSIKSNRIWPDMP